MRLVNFNGGLNTRLDPLLIAQNEAVVCENVDTSTGALKAARGTTPTTINIGTDSRPFYYQKGKSWQSRPVALEYMEYQERLYWTTAGRPQTQTLDLWRPIPVELTSSFSAKVYSLVYGGGLSLFTELASNTVYRSLDEGETWIETTTTGTDGGVFEASFYAFSRFYGSDDTKALTSLDGIAWTDIGISGTHHHYAFSGSTLVALLDTDGTTEKVFVSTDGTTWNTFDMSLTFKPSMVAWGNDLFVAFGKIGAAVDTFVSTSLDGEVWTEPILLVGFSPNDLTFGKGKFVAVGSIEVNSDSTVATSEDGVTWIKHAVHTNAFWGSVAFGGDLFVATAKDVSNTVNTIMVSFDTVEWFGLNQNTLQSNALLGQVVFIGNTFLIANTLLPTDLGVFKGPAVIDLGLLPPTAPLGTAVDASSAVAIPTGVFAETIVADTVSSLALRDYTSSSLVGLQRYTVVHFKGGTPYKSKALEIRIEPNEDPGLQPNKHIDAIIAVSGVGITCIVYASASAFSVFTRVTSTLGNTSRVLVEKGFWGNVVLIFNDNSSAFAVSDVVIMTDVDGVPSSLQGVPLTVSAFNSGWITATLPDPSLADFDVLPTDGIVYIEPVGSLTTVVGESPHDVNELLAVDYIFGVAAINSEGRMSALVEAALVSRPTLSYTLRINATPSVGNKLAYFVKLGGSFFLIQSFSTFTSIDYIVELNPEDSTVYSADTLTGNYRYTYTYYNSRTGLESAQAELSPSLQLTAEGAVVSNILPSPDIQVDKVRLYRIGGILLALTLVDTFDVSLSSYSDFNGDTALSTTQLTSTFNGPPPVGLRYITNIHGIFVGSVGSRLYFTRDVGDPNYWPATYFLNFPAPITGIGYTGSNTIVFTRYKSYTLSGSSAASLRQHPLSGDQGCLNHATVANKGSNLVFVSSDGICATSGGTINVLSKVKLGKVDLSGSINAVIHDEVYYLQLATKVLALDFRYEPSIKFFNLSTTFLAVADDVLHGKVGPILHTLFSSSDVLTYTYKTGEIKSGALTDLKAYGKIHVYNSGTVSFTLDMDEKRIVDSKILTGGASQFNVPQANQQAYKIQVEASGTGTIHEIELIPSRGQDGK